jgi:Flp pilus assembly pilin Flp
MRFPSAPPHAAHRVRPWRKRGQTLVEYALVLAVLTIVMIACMRLLGARIVVIFSDITAILDTAQSSH